MKKLLLLLAVFGLLVPGISLADDIYSVGATPYGAARFTADVYGFNNAIATAEESIWDGDDASGAANGPVRCFTNLTATEVPTAAALYISSDDEDDSSDGTGVVVVTVEALDANWDPVTIVAPLGAAAAGGTLFAQVGSQTLMRVNRAYVSSATAAFPEGNIYIGKDVSDGGTDGIPDTIATDHVAQIVIGANETRQACYSVPNNYKAYMSYLCVHNDTTTGTGIVDYRLRTRENGQPAKVRYGRFELASTLSSCQTFSPPMKIDEKTDIQVTGHGGTSESSSATFGLVLIKNGQSLSGL